MKPWKAAGRVMAASVLCAALLSCGFEQSQTASAYAAEGRQATVTALFSPRGGITEAIETEILSARKSVDVFAYLFTSRRISEALAVAVRKGISVRVILDARQAQDVNTEGEFLSSIGAAVYADADHANAHSKYIVVDGKTVITGSFNLTITAEENNAEDMVFLRGSEGLGSDFTANFESHLVHCGKFGK